MNDEFKGWQKVLVAFGGVGLWAVTIAVTFAALIGIVWVLGEITCFIGGCAV